jgi:hypothetical protein
MLSKSASGYTAEQVEAAIRGEFGITEFRWKAVLLDKYRNVVNDNVTTLEDGSLDYVRNRRIRGGGQFKFVKRDVALADYSVLVLQSSPIVYFEMGEASGTTMEDSSGNNRDGIYNNTPTLNVSSLLKGQASIGAVQFASASSEYGSVADNAAFDVAQLTAKAWFSSTTSGAIQTIIARSDGTTASVFDLRINASGYLEAVLVLGGSLTTFTTDTKVNNGASYEGAVSCDGSFVTIYINGKIAKRWTQSGALNTTCSLPITVGRKQSNQYFNGVICRAAVYGAAVPAQTIRNHYKSGAAELSEINFATERLKLYLQLLMEDGGYAEFPKGEWLMGLSVTPETETGTKYEVLAFDKIKKLDDYRFSDRRVFASGTLFTDAIATLLALVYLAGEYSVSSTSTAVMTASMSFQVGDNLLDAVTKLYTAIDYDLNTDGNGQVLCQEYTKPENRAVDDEWDVDNGQSFLTWERTVSSNFNETYNYVIAKSVSPKNGTIDRAIAKNENGSHPSNIQDTGQRTFVYEVQASDTGTLQQIADRKLIEVSAPVEKFASGSVFRPFYEVDEKIRRIEDGETNDFYFEERHMIINGKAPFIENYILNRIYTY